MRKKDCFHRICLNLDKRIRYHSLKNLKLANDFRYSNQQGKNNRERDLRLRFKIVYSPLISSLINCSLCNLCPKTSGSWTQNSTKLIIQRQKEKKLFWSVLHSQMLIFFWREEVSWNVNECPFCQEVKNLIMQEEKNVDWLQKKRIKN